MSFGIKNGKQIFVAALAAGLCMALTPIEIELKDRICFVNIHLLESLTHPQRMHIATYINTIYIYIYASDTV